VTFTKEARSCEEETFQGSGGKKANLHRSAEPKGKEEKPLLYRSYGKKKKESKKRSVRRKERNRRTQDPSKGEKVSLVFCSLKKGIATVDSTRLGGVVRTTVEMRGGGRRMEI